MGLRFLARVIGLRDYTRHSGVFQLEVEATAFIAVFCMSQHCYELFKTKQVSRMILESAKCLMLRFFCNIQMYSYSEL